MKSFLKQIILFFLFFSFLSIILIVTYILKNKYSYEDIPAPNFTNSFSYNEKVLFSHSKKANILAIGSSMSLNNLNSATIVDLLHSDSYLNLSSWGINMEENYKLLQMYSPQSKPSILIISSSLGDFGMSDKLICYNYIRNYLKDNTIIFTYYYLKNFDCQYYLKNLEEKEICRSSNGIYASVKYDKYGGVLLDSLNFKINKDRWNNTAISIGQSSNYQWLDSIAGYCHRNNIKLLFIQSPFREGIAMQLSKDSILLKHIAKVNKIVSSYGQVFINGDEKIWPDSLFVDATHMNAKGARKFTEHCIKIFNKIY